jgi:hypothetical protein
MALIDLKTKLTSLKFGSDRPLGGSSNQPYEQFPIPEEGTKKIYLDFYNINKTGLDYPIRGGSSIVNPTGGSLSTIAGQIDRDRIAKFFKDEPRGKAFLDLQKGLQLSNPRTQTSIAIGAINGISDILNNNDTTGTENTRVYNDGRNTLAQVLASGTGAHIIRHGAIPTDILGANYLKTIGAEMGMTVEDVRKKNRLVLLQRHKLIDEDAPAGLGISLNPNILFQYLGGPGSVYGIGSTTINRAQNTNDAYQLTQNRADIFPNVFTMTYDQIANDTEVRKSRRTSDVNGVGISDFRDKTGAYGKINAWDNSDSLDYRFYSSGVDKLNQKINFATTDEDPFTIVDNNNKVYDDIIKFGFECMSNDSPGESTPLIFRAFLTKGIGDTNTAEWSGFKYMGRGETFYTYQGFQRSISFGFKIVAFSADEMIPLYEKLNYLVSQTYPDYSDKGYMRAPLVKVTIGDYLYRVPGFLESVNLTIDNNAPWELNLDNDNNTYQLPKVIDVDISFKPIMNELPRRARSGDAGTYDAASIIGRPEFNGAITPIDPFVNLSALDKTTNNLLQKNLQPIKFDGLSEKQNAKLNNYKVENASAAAAKTTAPVTNTKTTAPVTNTKTTKKTKKK